MNIQRLWRTFKCATSGDYAPRKLPHKLLTVTSDSIDYKQVFEFSRSASR
jgi:hypothetical protein